MGAGAASPLSRQKRGSGRCSLWGMQTSAVHGSVRGLAATRLRAGRAGGRGTCYLTWARCPLTALGPVRQGQNRMQATAEQEGGRGTPSRRVLHAPARGTGMLQSAQACGAILQGARAPAASGWAGSPAKCDPRMPNSSPTMKPMCVVHRRACTPEFIPQAESGCGCAWRGTLEEAMKGGWGHKEGP